MDRALVVVDDKESGAALLTEAASVAEGTGADLVLASFVTEEEYEHDQETLQQIGEVEGRDYTESPGEFARNLVTHLAEEHVDGVDYKTIGEIVEEDDQADRILDIADEEECDYVYLAGKRRSPTGKALFGDRTQQVLLNFPDYVVVTMS